MLYAAKRVARLELPTSRPLEPLGGRYPKDAALFSTLFCFEMRYAHVNIGRALQDKIFELVMWAENSQTELVAVSETGLCPDVCFKDHVCAVLPEVEGWNWYGLARNNRGGGVGFLVHEKVAVSQRPDLSNKDVEQMWLEIYRDKKPVILACSVYIPPNNKLAMKQFSEVVERAKLKCSSLLIMGDLNARSTVFGDTVDNSLAPFLHTMLSQSDLSVVNSVGVYTRVGRGTNSILDFTICSQDLLRHVHGWRVCDKLPSDHLAVLFQVGSSKCAGEPKDPPKISWDLKRCDWKNFENDMNSKLSEWEQKVTRKILCFDSVDELYNSWLEVFMDVVNRCVQVRRLTERSRAFWNREIEGLVCVRRKMLRRYRRYPTLKAKEDYQKAHGAARRAIKDSKSKLLKEQSKWLNAASPQEIARRFRRVTSRKVSQVPVLVTGERVLRNRKSQVEAFSTFFSQKGESNNPGLFDEAFKAEVDNVIREHNFLSEDSEAEAYNCSIRTQEVRSAVERLGSFKTPGPDLVHPMFLKHGGEVVVRTLTLIFNVSFNLGVLPRLWKIAIVSPIPKRQGSKIEDYRPISVLSIPGKLMDRVLSQRLSHVLETRYFLKPFQGGFRPGRSTTDQLLAFKERVQLAFAHNFICVTAFLDISSAYDSLWKNGLIYKLKKLGFEGKLLRWIYSFLMDRIGSVCVANCYSSKTEYKNGLPQGSCMSPILFNVFLSDMFPRDFIDFCRDVGIFADDIRVSTTHRDITVASEHLTRQLTRVATFGRKWRITFDTNSSKCGVMVFARRLPRIEIEVLFGAVRLSHCSVYKYLGVIFDNKLTFSQHIKRVRQHAWAASHTLRKLSNRFWGLSFATAIRLYVSFVCPHLEYACPVWSTAAKSILDTLEPIQSSALRNACGAKSSTSRAALQTYCGVWPLQTRRDFLSVSQFLRIRALDPLCHPVASVYRMWKQATEGRHVASSVFTLSSAVLRSLKRYQVYSDGGDEFAEVIRPFYYPPWGPQPPDLSLPDRTKRL